MTPPDPAATGYQYASADAAQSEAYLLPSVLRCLAATSAKRVFDLGCGNGATAAALVARGYDVTGVDTSEDGIRIANRVHPTLRLNVGSAYDDLAARFGRFDAVVSLEVVEHVYFPRIYAKCVFNLLEPGGIAVLSTPYHSYLKNVALALTGKMDAHFTALWDHGHIKFWSPNTLGTLLSESGLQVDRVLRVGRIPVLAKSMIMVARRPA